MEKLERKKKSKNYKEEYVTKDELMLILDNYVLKDKKESKSDKIKRLLTSIEGKNENFNSRLLHKSMQTNSNDSKDSFEDYSNWLKKHNKNDSDTTEETVKIEHPNKEYYNACLTKKVKKYLNDYAKRKAMNEKRKL
ncbi:hypothetical protein HERIO_406 [Hepatospora eriocheir]|uniref:Uncharacterized protein n=1 Tax=Hepatospora eriocheir TaxID=1081669 RepID=A0A1X0QD43_9MICR|nr:hypothetical protein HERIO_406 [Hepatospora eriocheir]